MEHRLGIVDLTVFSISLLLSVAVGLFYMWRERNLSQKRALGLHSGSKSMDFLVGGQNLPMSPVALSVVTTCISGVSVMGVPSEIYLRGGLFFVWYWTAPLTLLIAAYFFVPLFYQFRPVSIFEYFELRFNSRFLRKLSSGLFVVSQLFYLGVVMYAPAVALSGVTTLETTPLILVVAAVCTFYTSLGGLKAVIWTDALQAGFLYSGIITMAVMGTNASGGLAEVWRIASEYQRFAPLANIDPNPAQYSTLWCTFFGGIAAWTANYGLNQMAMQRYCNLPNLATAYKMIGITIPMFLVMGTICCFNGLIMFAYFYKCDPLQDGQVETKDQLVILMVMNTLGQIPGLAGVFIACLFSATLSTVSSGINAMAACTWEDFLKRRFSHISDNSITRVSKGVSMLYGVIAMGLAFAASTLGGLVSVAVAVTGALTGPLVGLFCLGIFIPQSNKYGAMTGISFSLALLVWMAIGNTWNGMYRTFHLPFNNTGCANSNATTTAATYGYDTGSPYGDTSVFFLYRLSTFMYTLLGVLCTIVIGTVVSLALPKKFCVGKTTFADIKLTHTWKRSPKRNSVGEKGSKVTFF